MVKEFELLLQKFKRLVESDFVGFEDVSKLKNITGVYMIYNENSEIIYIGHTNKFHVRFGTDLMHESTHTLVRKLIRIGWFENRQKVKNYLKNKCRMRIEQCLNKREAEALEHIAILILSPVFNK